MQLQKNVGSKSNAALAYKFWLARGFKDGSPEEDMFRAVCANSINVGIRRRPSRHAAGKAEAMGASAFAD
jgi:hypothetical protein